MFEAFAIGIRLRLLDGVTSGLVNMAGQFTAFNRTVNGSQANLTALESQIKRIKTLGLVGGVAASAGIAGLGLLRGPLEAARQYELAFTKFKTLNLGEAVNTQANQFARSADIMGVSATQLMKTMSESVGIFGGFSEAQKVVPKIAALNAANSAIFKGRIGEIDDTAARSLALFMDRRGLTRDAAGYDVGMDLAERMVTGSGGFIQFKDLANFSQQAGMAFRGLSDTGLVEMSQLIQEQGGARAGTALMSLNQNLLAGRTPKKTMELLQDLGLGHIGQVISGTVGGLASTTTKFQLDSPFAALLQAAPVEFFDKVVLPKLAARGITGESDILRITNDLLSNRLSANQGSIMTTQTFQIMRDAALVKNAMGAQQVINAYRNDPNARWGDLQSKYQGLMIELGESVLPLAIKGVEGLTSAIKAATAFSREFPILTSGITTSFAVLSGLVAVGGTLTLTKAAFEGLGLALTTGKAGSIASQIAETALAISGPGGLVLGIGALVGATVGAAALLNKFGPLQHQNDGLIHAGQHWIDGMAYDGAGNKIFSRAGGSWQDNMRWVGAARNRHQEYWNSDSNSWGAASSAVSPYIALPKPKMVAMAPVTINMDGKAVYRGVLKFMTKDASAPQTGSSGFDASLGLAPAGGVGGY